MVKVKLCVILSTTAIFILFGVFLFLMSTVNPKPLVTSNKTQDLKPMAEDDHDVVFPMPSSGLSYGLAKSSESDIINRSKKVTKLIPMYNNLVKKGVLINSSKGKEDLPSKNVRRSVNDIEDRNRNSDHSSGVILKIIDDSGNPRIEIKLGPKGNLEGAKRSYRSLPSNSVDNASYTSNKMEAMAKNSTGLVIKILLNDKLFYSEESDVNNKERKSNKTCLTCSNSLIDDIQEINNDDSHEILILINTKESNHENIDKTLTMNYTDLATLSMFANTSQLYNSQQSTINFANNVSKEYLSHLDEEKVSFIKTETEILSSTGLQNATGFDENTITN